MSAGNASGKLITRLPESRDVAMYVAVSTCVGSLAGGMGPLVAGLLLHALEGVQWTVGARALGGFHVLFALSLLLRNASTLILRRIHEPGGASVPQRQPLGRRAQAVGSHDG